MQNDGTSVYLFCPLCVQTLSSNDTENPRPNSLEILRRQLERAREITCFRVIMVKIVVLDAHKDEMSVRQAIKFAEALCAANSVPSRVSYFDRPWVK